MPANPPTFLLTRPAADAEALAEWLEESGARVVVSPLMKITAVPTLPKLEEALIFTSRNGVAVYGDLNGAAGLPTWCVGPRTAAAAEALGLDVRGHAETAAALAKAIPSEAPKLLHLRGAVQRGDLVDLLRSRGIAARDAVIYSQDACDLSDAALDILRSGAVIVPLYSPRTAQLFLNQCPPEALPHCTFAALSDAVAEVLPVPSEVAERPDGAAMEDLLRSLAQRSAVEGRTG